MTIAIGLDLGTRWLRVAALVDGAPVVIATLPAAIGFLGAEPCTGDALASCRPEQRVDAVTAWLAAPATVGGSRGAAWPVVDGVARSPVELVAHLVRAAIDAVEAALGPVAGAMVAVPLELGALERRVLRDGVRAAGVDAVRLVSAPAAAAVAIDDDRPARLLVIDAGAAELRATVVEHVDGVVDVLAHARGAIDGLAGVCDRALAAAAISAGGLSDAVVIGSGAAALAPRVRARFPHAARDVDGADTAVVRGAARLARLFVDEPFAITVDVIEPGFLLGAGTALTPMIPAGAIAPTREVRLITRDRPDRAAIDLELWEDGAPPRPYGRYHITGLTAGNGAVAACEVTVDVDRIPRVDASDLVHGNPLTVTPVVEVGLSPDEVAALRAVVTRRA